MGYQLIKKGLADEGIYEYELKSEYSYLRYRHDPNNRIFYLDNIGTPKEFRNQGHAKAIMEEFIKIIRQNNGRLDVGGYTLLGGMYIKHVIDRLAKQYNIKII